MNIIPNNRERIFHLMIALVGVILMWQALIGAESVENLSGGNRGFGLQISNDGCEL